MGLRKIFKKMPWLLWIGGRVLAGYRRLLFMISPKLGAKALYRHVFGQKMDMKNPRTFHEKLNWLKLERYMNDPLVIQCADKYAVRDYVESAGCGDVLNELYGVYDEPDSIDWETLPERFVLKWNFGAGYNIICSDKKKLNIPETVRNLKAWKKKKPWLVAGEMQYKYAPKKIICEKFLESETGVIPDYKVYCFHGEPQAILVMHDRDTGVKTEFFDKDWNKLKNTGKYQESEKQTEKPACLDYLLETARKLTKPFPFVRCDFYIVSGKVYFGEMTFTPAGGLYTSETEINGKNMTEFLQVP